MIKLPTTVKPSANLSEINLLSFSVAMAPKITVPKASKSSDKVKTCSILDVQGFLSHFNDSKEVKRVVKAFSDCEILNFLSFNYRAVHKEVVLEFYLNARITNERKIISTVASKSVEITIETIRDAYELSPATNVDVRNHAYSEKEFWGVIKNPAHSTEDMLVKSKKKDLLSPFCERIMDILYKCLDCKVATMDVVSA